MTAHVSDQLFFESLPEDQQRSIRRLFQPSYGDLTAALIKAYRLGESSGSRQHFILEDQIVDRFMKEGLLP